MNYIPFGVFFAFSLMDLFHYFIGEGIINAWEDAVTPIQAQLLFPFNLTFGLMALTVAFGVGYSLAIRYDMDAVMAGILSMLAFFDNE